MTASVEHLSDDHFHDECGVFGITGTTDAAPLTALGLHALQHRGQEACGMVAFDGTTYNVHRGMGLVSDTFDSVEVMASMKGFMAIGHNRYATTGATILRNVQPYYGDLDIGGFAVGHNGNLTNAYQLRDRLVKDGAIFQSTSDTEVIVHLVARAKGANVVDRMTAALHQIEGAYALVALAQGKLIGMRDPDGIRPLVLGKLGDAYVLASETVAFDIIGAKFVRNIEAGEMVVIENNTVTSLRPFNDKATPRFCIFEYVYFARPDSIVEDRSVYAVRKAIGAELAHEAPVQGADVVVPVPDSGVPSAIGYAQAAGLPFELGIIRNHYVGRTFIEPTDQIRHLGVKLKHNANPALLAGKSVVLVDDSIVRGTTSRKIVDMVRAAGAKSVHMRISSPPTAFPCFYGIDTPTKEELLANKMNLEDIAKFIGVDSLAYISLDGLYRALGEAKRSGDMPQFCDACFSGEYPVRLTDFEQTAQKSRPVTSMKEAKTRR